MSYRDDVDALRSRHEALTAEAAARATARDEAGRLLAEAEARRRLPILDNLRIAAPCAADWTKMVGDERVRHCGDCAKNVYNLSGMTRDEASALLAEHAGGLCVRYYQRADGTILLADDCAVGSKRRRRRRLALAGAAALLAGAATSAAAMVRRGSGHDPVAAPRFQMGATAFATPAQPRPAPSAASPPPPPAIIQGGVGPQLPPPPPHIQPKRGT
jgi:hypothetical protein